MKRCIILLVCAGGCLLSFRTVAAQEPVAHWKLIGNAQDSVGNSHGSRDQSVTFHEGEFPEHWAAFGGQGEHFVVPASDQLHLGTSDFAISVWVNTEAVIDDDLGDILSQFDAASRTGFHLSLRNNTGVTHSQANYRQLQFGIDAGTEPVFTDVGRPGNALFGQSMAVHDGALYVGTCEAGKVQAGHVYRLDGPGQWTDCGSPDRANSITGMAAWNGSLYVGSGKYRLGGSALAESENPHLGGRIFRYLGDQRWEEVGHFPGMETVGGMVVFQGRLHVGSLYKPAQLFRLEGDQTWTSLPVPNDKRVEALGVFNGALWASGYDEGHVYRFDGQTWTDLGQVGEMENTQTYAFTPFQSQLHVATWRSGKVFAWTNAAWQDRGRLGEELEVMGMLVHNGSLYGGTLPLAQIYRFDGHSDWTLLKQLDTTPDVMYRRVWTMAQYQGRLFATTLPSGHVWSMQTGTCVTWDKEFPSGWHHVVAQRQGGALRLYVDGQVVAQSADHPARSLDLKTDAPWRIGAGTGDSFHGGLADIRVFRTALSPGTIRDLAQQKN